MNREVYKHLLHTYGRNPTQWLGFLAEIVRTLMVRVWSLYLVSRITSDVARGDISAAKVHIVHLTLVTVGGALIGIGGELLAMLAENKEQGRLILSYHKKLINKDMTFYRDNQTGYLATVFRQHLDSAMLLIRFWRSEASRTAVSLTAPALVLLVMDWRVGLVALGVIVVQFIYINWSSARARQYRIQSNEIYRKLTGEVSDEITNIVAFKSSGVEQEAESKIEQLGQQEIYAYSMRRKIVALLDLPRSIITAAAIALALYFAVRGASTDPASVGLVVLSLTYMFQINRNVGDLPNLIVEHDDLVTKLYPTLMYLSGEYETIQDPAKPKPLKVRAGQIDIENVSFSYPSHSGDGSRIPVFKDLTINIAGGEQVGIVGLSGAGKSTLANLLMRFDDIEAGTIKIDGIDIRDVRQSDLRRNIAYVPQEPLLFHRTIRENIAYFKEKTSQAAIVKAAKAAHAHEFVDKLPNKYDTIVGERGIKLSGGQKQRVVIARAILKRAPIMLFDEATSALDSESEQIIQKALPQILGKQTALIIAHRLSTVAGLDRIIVMHNGKITEQGTHAQLLKQKGRYYSLWQKQTNGNGAD